MDKALMTLAKKSSDGANLRVGDGVTSKVDVSSSVGLGKADGVDMPETPITVDSDTVGDLDNRQRKHACGSGKSIAETASHSANKTLTIVEAPGADESLVLRI
ncbi:uncharacterized protein LOC141725121 isoform X2 [Apium graveolens]